jgi:L-histidine N-alpha-methyltransferase
MVPAPRAALHRAIADALAERPRRLPTAYLYDAVGSHLFEAICELPQYRIKRAEKALLGAHVADLVAALGPIARIVELGSGSGDKLELLLDGLPREVPLDIVVVDISPTALELSRQSLRRHPQVRVRTVEAEYGAGLAPAMALRGGEGATLVLFLGSNIGNFEPAGADALLAQIRAPLRHGDGLLLGADLVKPEADLVLAYDDPVGVTAAFNKNLLQRLNVELAADFELRAWDHLAEWNPHASRMEMYLVSRVAQTVRVPALDLTLRFDAGERIFTESSHKYTPESLTTLGARAGLTQRAQWIDGEALFASTLFVVS